MFARRQLSAAFVRLFCLATISLALPLVFGISRADPEPAPIPVSVQLDWIPNAQFAGILVAKESGLYTTAGMDVRIKGVETETLDQFGPVLNAQGLAIGVADGSALLRKRKTGAPVKAVATMFQASPLGIIALEDNGFVSLKALRGKRIGLHHYNMPQLDVMLRHHGMTIDDVVAVSIGDDIESLSEGRIDAQVCYYIDEAVMVRNRGHEVTIFHGHDNGYTSYSQVYFTTEPFWKDHTEMVATFIRCSNEGWKMAMADKEATAEMIVRKYQPDLKVRDQRMSLELIEPLLDLESGDGSYGSMRRETWLKTPGATEALIAELVEFSAF